MPPSARSTVIEIVMYGGTNGVVPSSTESNVDHISGYTFDYEMLARNMGHKVSGSIIFF